MMREIQDKSPPPDARVSTLRSLLHLSFFIRHSRVTHLRFKQTRSMAVSSDAVTSPRDDTRAFWRRVFSPCIRTKKVWGDARCGRFGLCCNRCACANASFGLERSACYAAATSDLITSARDVMSGVLAVAFAQVFSCIKMESCAAALLHLS